MAGFWGNAVIERLKDVRDPVMAEIGVLEGANSAILLARLPTLTLYMVDQWKAYTESGQPDTAYTGVKWDNLHKMAVNKTRWAAAEGRRIILRGDSAEMAKQLPDASLDLVWIDANHSYEFVVRDIAAYWPKVKPYGWLAGHDYEHTDKPKYGVKQAVHEFAGEMGLHMELDEDTSWFCRRLMESGNEPPTHVKDYARLIRDGRHFAQANYGDGEWACMLGHAGGNVDGTLYDEDLSNALKHTLLAPSGMWCGTNPGPSRSQMRDEAEAWVRRNDIRVQWKQKEILPDANRTGRLGIFLDALRRKAGATAIVGGSWLGKLPASVLGPYKLIPVDGKEAWKSFGETCGAIRKAVKPGDVVLFAAGMASNLMIHELWPEYEGKVTLLDVGATLDPYAGRKSRQAHRRPEFQEALRRNLEVV